MKAPIDLQEQRALRDRQDKALAELAAMPEGVKQRHDVDELVKAATEVPKVTVDDALSSFYKLLDEQDAQELERAIRMSQEVQTSIRLDVETMAILDKMVPLLKAHPALKYARASRGLAIRAAVERGLEQLASELGTTIDALKPDG